LCIESGNSLSLNLQLLLPLSQVVQDEWPPHFVLKSSGLPSSAKSGRDLCIPCDRHQKVLLSNLSLAVFVRHLVDLVKQVPQSPSGKKKWVTGTETSKVFWLSRFYSLLWGWEEAVKGIEISMGFSIFVSYCSKKKNASYTPSLFTGNIFTSQDT
jgi:hypothetical protein